MKTLLNNSPAKHTIDLLNANGHPFVRITKVGTSYYVNEYPEDKDLGRWADTDSLADYVYYKFASQWRAKHIINLLITGEKYEYSDHVADCYKVVR